MKKMFWAKSRFCVVLWLIFLSTALNAEVFKPLQIILPGNFRGAATDLDRDLQTTPALCWNIPDVVQGLQNNSANTTVIFATGNDSSIFSPLSFLSAGAVERDLIDATRPDAAGFSPADLEVLSGHRLDNASKKRIWTNHESATGKPIFRTHEQLAYQTKKLWLFNFISNGLCQKLPIHKLGQFNIDDPARSLRRLSLPISDDDYTISIAHLNATDLQSLSKQLQQTPGHHFLIQVPLGNNKPEYSVLYGEPDANIFKMSLRPGHSCLPVLNIFSKNHGAPRMTLRMLPLSKSQTDSGKNRFIRARSRIAEHINQTLRVVKTTHQASTSAFRFRPQIHARIVQNQTGCDLTFMIVPETKHFNDNVICTGHVIAGFSNDRIVKVSLRGNELHNLFEKLISARGSEKFAFAGCNVNYLAGRITSFEVGGQILAPEKLYLCSTTESSLQDIICASFLAGKTFEIPDGQTLWQLWQNGLKSLKITDEVLIDE